MIKVVVNMVSLMNYSQIKESNGLKEAVTKIYEQNILILVEKLQLI